MKFLQLFSPGRYALAFITLLSLSCKDSTSPAAETPVLSSLVVALQASAIETGETVSATVSGRDQNEETIGIDGTVTWSTSASAVATVDHLGNIVGVAAGTAKIIATVNGKAGEQSITVSAPAGVIFNEVESNGGTPGDWVELYNPTSASADISGWVFKDNDDSHVYTLPAGTVIPAGGYRVLDEASFGFGLGAPESVRLFNKFGVLVTSYTWTAHATTTYGRCPNLTGEFTTTTTSTKGAANDCSLAVRINEVESNGGTPGDWIELYNAGPSTANLAGFVVKDNDDSHGYTLPAGTTLAPGAFLVIEESALGFGLGGDDAARLFDASGAVVDSYSWTAHAAVTYGRCADGVGAFINTFGSTKGLANACAPGGPVAATWPGSGSDIATVDGTSVFGSNLSGLTYEAASGPSPAILWAVQNGPGTLYRLIWNGTIWTQETTNGWNAGKALRYPGGTGDPDSEGVTFAGSGSAEGIYVATERNNAASSVSRNAILRFDPTQTGTTLTATHEWNITSDLPVVGANLGIEAITWVPDSYLVSKGFYDEAAGRVYTPSDYPNHGTGLFFVGVEGNGIIYAYALNHSNSTFTRVATINTGFPGVMGLEFDRDAGYFWATCDDGCGNQSAVLEINQTAGSPALGRFVVTKLFNRPTAMPNINNEGFAIEPQSACVAGFKNVYWADDGETDGHSIRRGKIPCGALP